MLFLETILVLCHIGSILKPGQTVSGSFTTENIKELVIWSSHSAVSSALLKLDDNRLLLNCSIVIQYSSIQTNGQEFTQK